MYAIDYLRRTLGVIACEAFSGNESLDELVAMWHTPMGVELARNFKFPSDEFFRTYKDELTPMGVMQDTRGLWLYNRNVVLVNSTAIVEYSCPQRLRSVILYGDSEVVVKASNYAVVRISDVNGQGSVSVENDDTAEIIISK